MKNNLQICQEKLRRLERELDDANELLRIVAPAMSLPELRILAEMVRQHFVTFPSPGGRTDAADSPSPDS